MSNGLFSDLQETAPTWDEVKRLVGESPQIRWIKKNPDAKLPTLAHDDDLTGDTGYDIYGVEEATILPMESKVVPVGLEVAYITPGYWFKISAKSGLGFKHDLFPHPGIIDNGYRGDCGIKIYNFGKSPYTFDKGDKIAQLVIYELHHAEMSWADEKIESKRGTKGYGSTGK